MSVPGIIAGKAGSQANKALTGDIYVRRWTSKGKGKKPPVEHEVRVNAVTAAVAAVGVGLAALAGGAALWMTQQKLEKGTGPKYLIRRIRAYDAVIEQVKIVDSPAHQETENVWQEAEGHWITVATATKVCDKCGASINLATATEQQIGMFDLLHDKHTTSYSYASGQAWVVDRPAGIWPISHSYAEVYHYEDRLRSASRTLVMSARGVPMKYIDGPADSHALILGPKLAADWTFDKIINTRTGEDRFGPWTETAQRYKCDTKHPLQLTNRPGLLE